MRRKCLPALVGLTALALIPGDDAYGQRGGRGGGGRGGAIGGARGGAVGGARVGGAAIGPYGGAGAGGRSVGTVVGPAGGARTVGTTGGSYTTGRGSTINYGGAGRTVTGPGGATAGRGVGGVQVTTPGGRTATKVGAVGGVQGPGGATAVRGGSVGAATGPRGAAVTGSRGGVAVGPGGAVGGVARGTVAAGPYGGYASAARGVAVTAPAGHFTAYRGAAAVRTQAGYVRAGFGGYSYFNGGWYARHPAAWRAAAWGATAYWRWAPYATVATFCGYPATPVVYDYGSTLVYQDNSVYYNGEPIATADEYTAQAASLAARGEAVKPAEQEEWQSLGVFAMVQGDDKDATDVFQLAINKDGVLRGNYHNTLTDTTIPIFGQVDKKTQRAAWTVGSNRDVVYETGVGNLSQPETSMLVHLGKDRTQQRTLVRLEPPEEIK
jgi:hypothetical protein